MHETVTTSRDGQGHTTERAAEEPRRAEGTRGTDKWLSMRSSVSGSATSGAVAFSGAARCPGGYRR